MSENQPESTPDTTVNVQGDAVVNQAPDGGGVDNNAAGSGSQSGEAPKTAPGDTETSV